MNPKELTKPQMLEVAQQTPAGLAWVLSGGRWHCARHLEALNDRLLDLTAGRIMRLAVFMPPRHGKSQLCSRYFPAWFLGMFPDSRVIQAGYGNSFAATWGRYARSAIDEAQSLGVFGVRVDPAKSSAEEWDISGREGGMYCVGIGGGVTGRGADCLVGSTLIATERGPVPIAELAAQKTPPRVFHTTTKVVQWFSQAL